MALTSNLNEQKEKLISLDGYFFKRINYTCPIKSFVISPLDIYDCGCGIKHSISCNGGHIIKQTNLYEYVISCSKGYLKLLTYSFTEHDLVSIMAIKIQQPSNAAVYGRVQKSN